MEIILLENILNLGNVGDKVTVKNGYGRNFLLKKGKALRFSKSNLDLVNKKKDELNKKNNEIKNKFKSIAKIINNKTFAFFKESKENGELYGSLKPKEIINVMTESTNAGLTASQMLSCTLWWQGPTFLAQPGQGALWPLSTLEILRCVQLSVELLK